MKKALMSTTVLIIIASIPALSNIIYVPGDYTTIQGAVEAALAGDTVMVAPATYNENVVIDHDISLIGRDRDQTIIDGNQQGDVVVIESNGVYVRSFTITNSGPEFDAAGIQIGCSDSCVVELCIFPDNTNGVELYGGSYNTIAGCRFDGNVYGILFWEEIEECEQDNLCNNILNNVFENSSTCAIMFEHMMYHHDANIVMANRVSGCNMGMSMIMSYRNEVSNNEFIENTWYGLMHGICEGGGGQNQFHHNNFIENNGDTIQAMNLGFGDDLWYCIESSKGNYWSNYTGPDNNGDGIGDIPFDIEGDQSQDLYPFMEPLEAGILGMITDASYVPIPDVVVTAIGTEIVDTSEYHGGYTLNGLGSGNYDILFSHPDYRDTVVIGYGTSIDGFGYLDMELEPQTGIEIKPDQNPRSFSLIQNIPNPFNAATIIGYNLPKSTCVKIEIFDLLGRKIETLVDEIKPAGHHQILWNSGDLPSGIYYYKIRTDETVETKKMMLLK